MSTKTVRRHGPERSPAPPAAFGKTTAQRVWTLIRLRDHLAAIAAAYDAHDIDGGIDVLIEQWAIESAICELAPAVYRDRSADWGERDRDLMHTPDEPNPHCHICAMNYPA